jgi:hypothetical protein
MDFCTGSRKNGWRTAPALEAAGPFPLAFGVDSKTVLSVASGPYRVAYRREGVATMTRERPLTYLQAAIPVLEVTKRPMTSGEITAEAIRRGLVRPGGRTPEATMSAQLYLHARDEPEPRIRRLHEAGPNRARRGSVRWVLARGSRQRR